MIILYNFESFKMLPSLEYSMLGCLTHSMESLEVLLKADATRPGLPVAELPAEILRQLEVEILIGCIISHVVDGRNPAPPAYKTMPLGRAGNDDFQSACREAVKSLFAWGTEPCLTHLFGTMYCLVFQALLLVFECKYIRTCPPKRFLKVV